MRRCSAWRSAVASDCVRCTGVCWPVLPASVAGAVIAWWRMLPEPLFATPQSYVLEARDGTLLSARIAADGQWRFPAAGEVPEKFRRALLVYEDKRFERSPGCGSAGHGARACSMNVRAGRVVSGGSTLTMQLARLAKGREGRSYLEKSQEVLLALRIECSYDKDEILALYAAHAPFGGNVVGLEAASWRYFGRGPRDLSWAEAATLAVLPNNPSLVHVSRNRSRLLAKRDELLRRLQDAGDLSALDLELALSEPLVAEPHELPDLAPHLLETLRLQFPAQHRLRTTLDARLQATAHAQLMEHSATLARQQVNNAAALIIDNGTSKCSPTSATRQLPPPGHAVDIIRRPRSTGSILKPLLYAAMLDDGSLTPRMLLPDVPTHYEGFSPENFDRQYRGAVPADEALAHSLNVPAVRMLKTYGVARFADLLRGAGMSTLTRPADDYGLTLILGGAEGNLWDISALYAGLANIARHRLRATRAAVSQTHACCLPVRRDRRRAIRPSAPGSLADARCLARGAASRRRRPLAQLRGQPRHRLENRHELRPARWLGRGQHFALHGRRVGGQCQRRRPPGPHRFQHGRAADVRIVWRSAGERLVRHAHARAAADRDLRQRRLPALPRLRNHRARWVPRDSHFDALSPHNLRVHLDARRRACTAIVNRPAACRTPAGSCCRPAEEYYYRRAHAEYRPLPALRADCQATAGYGAAGAGAALSRVQCARPDPARARRHARTHGVRGRRAPPRRPRSTGISTADTWEKRTLFTSSRWTSTPASTY